MKSKSYINLTDTLMADINKKLLEDFTNKSKKISDDEIVKLIMDWGVDSKIAFAGVDLYIKQELVEMIRQGFIIEYNDKGYFKSLTVKD